MPAWLSEKGLEWLYKVGEKLGVPVFLFCLMWFTLGLPATQRHFQHLDTNEETLKTVAEILRESRKDESQMRIDTAELVIRNREQVTLEEENNTLLKQIRERQGMN